MPSSRMIAGIALAAVAAVSLGASACSKRSNGRQVEAASDKKAPQIRIIRVEPRQVRRAVESVGTLFPFEEVTVSSEVEGRVEEVLVDVGDHVTAGQPLVKVSPTELQLTLDQQRASMRQARARLGLPEEGDDLKDVGAAAGVKKAQAATAD